MSETMRSTNMHDVMLEQMASTLLANADEIASVIGAPCGDGSTESRLAHLMAQLIMDRITGRTLIDPGHKVSDMVKDAEACGMPMTVVEQELMASRAMELLPYWGGNKIQTTIDVLWRMLLNGRFPHEHSQASLDAARSVMAGSVSDEPAVQSALDEVRNAHKGMFDAIESACGSRDVSAFKAYIRDGSRPEAERDKAKIDCTFAVDSYVAATKKYDHVVADAYRDRLAANGITSVSDSDIDVVASNARPSAMTGFSVDADNIRRAMEPYLR